MKNLILIIIGLLLIVGPSIYHDNNDKYVQIEGTVIAKSDEITTHYKSTKITTDYILAIHPNDSAKYITKQENSEFDIDINNLNKGNINENIFDFMTFQILFIFISKLK